MRDVASLTEERQRVGLLIQERQKKQAETEKALDAERQKTLALARQVDNLKDLIGKVGAGTRQRQPGRPLGGAGRRGQGQGRPRRSGGPQGPRTAGAGGRFCLGPGPIAVSGQRRQDSRIRGSRPRRWNRKRAYRSQPGPAPRSRRPATAGLFMPPFRNYGQVLILNAGGGYHVVLAGMDRISVDVGQFVLTGEPVAVMGSGSQIAAPAAGSSQPVLYVEFRKDGTPVDPSPWWATSEGEKVRG